MEERIFVYSIFYGLTHTDSQQRFYLQRRSQRTVYLLAFPISCCFSSAYTVFINNAMRANDELDIFDTISVFNELDGIHENEHEHVNVCM